LKDAAAAPPDSAIHVRLAKGELNAVVRRSSNSASMCAAEAPEKQTNRRKEGGCMIGAGQDAKTEILVDIRYLH